MTVFVALGGLTTTGVGDPAVCASAGAGTKLPAAYDRRMWSIDRLHPGERGHRLLAGEHHALLAAAGFPVGPRPDRPGK